VWREDWVADMDPGDMAAVALEPGSEMEESAVVVQAEGSISGLGSGRGISGARYFT
jgi:hypothetical protein